MLGVFRFAYLRLIDKAFIPGNASAKIQIFSPKSKDFANFFHEKSTMGNWGVGSQGDVGWMLNQTSTCVCHLRTKDSPTIQGEVGCQSAINRPILSAVLTIGLPYLKYGFSLLKVYIY